MNTLLTDIISEMMLDLGNPAPTELTAPHATKKWNKAFLEFNKRVGKLVITTIALKANQQSYDLKQLYPASDIYNVLKVVRPKESFFEVYFPFEATVYYNGIAYNMKQYTDIELLNAMKDVQEYDMHFLEDLSILMLENPPLSDCSAVIMYTEPYTTTNLPDIYEPIITDYTRDHICQDIIMKARQRVATPLRNGDFVKFPVSHAKGKTDIEVAKTKFEDACDEIQRKRLFI